MLGNISVFLANAMKELYLNPRVPITGIAFVSALSFWRKELAIRDLRIRDLWA